MPIPKEIIDNSEGNKLVNFLNDSLRENKNTNLDIATAFFNIQAFSMLKDNVGGVKRFRLLIGTTPDIQNENTLGNVLLNDIRKEIEGFDLTMETEGFVRLFIEFIKKETVEVRLFERFLHGKAYIFDDRIVIGSSNFTSAGLTREGELNTWKQESQASYTRKEWFEKFWAQSRDFKQELIELVENSRFGSKEYPPYEIYIKSLYELQKDDIKGDQKDGKHIEEKESLVNLTDFQEDSIARVMTRLKKYGGCIVADSVGLGKTHIALKIIENFHLERRTNRILVICPAQLRNSLWRKNLKDKILPDNIISQEELATDDFLEKVKIQVSKLEEIELIVVDESHNFRNPLSNRWENLFTLINDHIAKKKRPKMLFLTATPINNTAWDLYWQIMLLVLMDNRAFIKENIPDLLPFFKRAKDSPSCLGDLLNEISIRRTRDYIIKNYPDAYYIDERDGKEKTIIFPDRVLENIDYKLDSTYKGMYKEISDTITKKLTMAYYNILKYRKEGLKTEDEKLALGRMIAIGGIFSTILLKRLESSVESFRISVQKHINFLVHLKKSLKSGKVIGKEIFSKLIEKFDMIGDDDIEEFLEDIENMEGIKLEPFNDKLYRMDDLFSDITLDVSLLKVILNKVEKIKPEDDVKLKVLKEKLLELSKDGQIVLFTYYADTLNYLYRQIVADKRFSKYRIEAISSSGSTSKNPMQREEILRKFFAKEVSILMSTDVLSEGQNLQTARYLINYDLHWNPTRMIQRAGRIDRIGSPYKKIFVYNFFPEDELEELLKLVEILQGKIISIDQSIGLDQTVLGEEIHPKVFGIIRKIRGRDSKVFDQIEKDAFGGGERFYQPLKDFLKSKAISELENIPYGVHSGLRRNQLSGIFFYYKYDKDFHFWYLYDIIKSHIISNKNDILNFIECKDREGRVIPDFFKKVYEINRIVVDRIKDDYSEVYSSQKTDSKFKEYSKSRSSMFVKRMSDAINSEICAYLENFPTDDSIQKLWDATLEKLLKTPLTKKRLQKLRSMWRQYRKEGNWKKLIMEISSYLIEKGVSTKVVIEPFDKQKLQLITVDFIS